MPWVYPLGRFTIIEEDPSSRSHKPPLPPSSRSLSSPPSPPPLPPAPPLSPPLLASAQSPFRQRPSPREQYVHFLPSSQRPSPREQHVHFLPSIQQQGHESQSENLDQRSRLHPPASIFCFQWILKQLGEVSTAIGKENAPLRDLMGDLAGLIRTTQKAAQSFLIERQQLLSQYFPRSPSIFMMTTVGRYQTNLIECCQMIENLIELVMKGDPTITYADALRAISAISSNIRDYMAYVLSQMIENFIELVMKDDPTITYEDALGAISAISSNIRAFMPYVLPEAPSFPGDSSASSGSRGGSSSAKGIGISRGGSSSERGSSSSEAKNKGKVLE